MYIQVIAGLLLGHEELVVDRWDGTHTHNLKRTLPIPDTWVVTRDTGPYFLPEAAVMGEHR